MSKHILRVIPASIIFLSAPTWAAEHQSSVSTSLGANARYEIVQSELVAMVTLRVDKVCGAVHQMIESKDGVNIWQFTPMENKPTCTADGRIRYQLFSSGIAVRYTYLMNTDNGSTWQLVNDSKYDLFWKKIS